LGAFVFGKESKESMKRTALPKIILSGIIGCAVLAGLSACSKTYREDTMAGELAKICRDEYGVDHIQVKIAGKTIGVLLPLDNLFSANFQEALANRQIQNLESLLQPSQEALDKVEDVLFSTSRVVLSADKDIDFYVLQAADRKTGLQLVLTGYVQDIKRVRLWDIPRSEYRKRVLHDLKLNRTMIWSSIVQSLFEEIGHKPAHDLLSEHFSEEGIQALETSPLYQIFLDAARKNNLHYDLIDIRSEASANNEFLVYVKVKETYEPKPGFLASSFAYQSGTELEFIFVVHGPAPNQYELIRVIPFFYIDDHDNFKRIQMPANLQLEENLSEWQSLFDVEDVQLGDFLARQLSRRFDALLTTDERVFNTFNATRVLATYHRTTDRNPAHFSLDFDLEPKHSDAGLVASDWVSEEDSLYVMNLVLREFVTLLRSYSFTDFSHFELINVTSPAAGAILTKSDLELFRQGKIDIGHLLNPVRPTF